MGPVVLAVVGLIASIIAPVAGEVVAREAVAGPALEAQPSVEVVEADVAPGAIALAAAVRSAVVGATIASLHPFRSAVTPSNIVVPMTASPPTTYAYTTDVAEFFVYAEAGETIDASTIKRQYGSAFDDRGMTVTLEGPGGVIETCQTTSPVAYDTPCVVPTATSGQSGVWRVSVVQEAGGGSWHANRWEWEIEVSDVVGPIDGRVWTESYWMQQLPTHPGADFSIWYVTDQGYQYQANHYGFNGFNSALYANATGVAYTDTCASAYRSTDTMGPNYDPAYWTPASGECGQAFKMFWDAPASDLPQSASRWDGSTDWIIPPVQNPAITSVAFDSDSPTVRSGTIDYEVSNFTGQLLVEIDTNGDGIYDVAIPGFSTNGAGSVYFDGLDGNDNPVSIHNDLDVRVSIDRVGEIHFIMWDVELFHGGLEVIRLNGPGAGDTTLYWDDTNLVEAGRACVTPQLDGSSGVNSTGGVHGWDCADNTNDGIGGSWGDQRDIDNWTYVDVDEEMSVIVAGEPLPTWECRSDGILFQYPGQVPPTQVQFVDLVTGDIEVGALSIAGRSINAAAYNIVDDYVYGWDNELANGGPDLVGIVRIGADGSAEELGMPVHPELDPTIVWPVGDIDQNGHYWVASSVAGGANARWYQIDLTETPPVVLDWGFVAGPGSIDANTFGASGDWAWVPGSGDHLWRVMRNVSEARYHLIRFDKATGTHHDVGVLPALDGVVGTFGAAYADPDFMYVSNNTTGDVYRIDVTAGTAAFFTEGPPSSANDGARCPIPIYTDYGDAPDSYGTLLESNGPRHGLRDYDPDTHTTSLMLGQGVSHETDGQPSVFADADDLDDGVAAEIVIFDGETTTVDVIVTNNTNDVATLAGWIDLDGNGTFDPGELVSLQVPANAGTATYQLTFPEPTTTDDTYARFRLFPGEFADVADIVPTGPASGGEVEDYLVTFSSPPPPLECPAGMILVPVSIIQNPSFEDRTSDFQNIDSSSTIGYAEHWSDSHPTGGAYFVFSPTLDSGPPVGNMPLRTGADGYAFMGGHSMLGAGEGATNVLAAPLVPGATYVGYFSMAAGGYGREGDGFMRFFGTNDPDVGHLAHAAVTPPQASNIETLFDTPVVEFAGTGVTPTWEQHTFTLSPSTAWDHLRVEVRNANPAADATTAGQTWVNFDDFHMFLCAAHEVDKTSDPASGTPVEPGDTVTYTVTVTNPTSEPLTGLEIFDDLSDVLDDAELTSGPTVDPPAAGTAQVQGDELTALVDVPADSAVTITYSVMVLNPVPLDGNGVLGNAVSSPGSLKCADPAITDPDDPEFDEDCVTSHEVVATPSLALSKTSDPPHGSDVQPGDVVTYTVVVTNDGPVTVTDTITDDLSGVLDDAFYNDDVAATEGDVSVTGSTLEWSGTLAPGESATITYSVTVAPFPGAQTTQITVLDTANVNSGDGWMVTEYDLDPGCATLNGPAAALPYQANWGNVHGWFGPAIAPRADQFVGGAGCYPGWTGYAAAPNRWVLAKTFNAPADGLATVLADGFRGDGGARVRVNGIDAGLYGQWNQPAVDGTAQIPVTEGPNTIEIEVRDTSGANMVQGRLDVLMVGPLGDGVMNNVVLGGQCPEPAITDPEDPDYDPDCHVTSYVRDYQVNKTATPADPAPGDTITYTIEVTNTGDVDYTVDAPATFVDDLSGVLDDATYNGDVSVDPPGAGTVTYTEPTLSWEGPLATGETVTITYTATVNDSGELGDGVLVNFVVGGQCPDPAITDPSEPGFDPACVEILSVPDHRVVKSSVPADGEMVIAGDVVMYTITVTNTGGLPYTAGEPIVVTDDLSGVLDDASYNGDASALHGDISYSEPELVWSGPLPVGESVEITYSVTVNAIDELGDGVLGNVISGGQCPDPAITDPDDPDYDPDCHNLVTVSTPSIEIGKTSNVTDAELGDVITYTFVAQNTGNVTLTDVSIEDEMDGLSALVCVPGSPATLAPNESMVCEATYTVTQDDVDSGAVSNSATATGTPPDGPDVGDDDEEEVPTPQDPAVELVKSADADDELPGVGELITYTFVATNTGNVTLTDVSIEDPMDGLSALDCTPVQPATLAPTETLECTATYTVTQDDVDAGSVSNTATATGTPPDGPDVGDDDDITVPSDPQPGLELSKTSNVTDAQLGEVITYTFVAQNTGNVTLTDVSIEDPMVGLSALVCVPGSPATLAPNESMVCEATYTVTQDDVDSGAVSNSATATGTPPDGPPVETDDEDEVPSDPQPGLELSKSSNVTEAELGDVITYTFVAQNTGNVTLTDVSIEDPMDGLSALDCTPVQPATLAPTETLECTATYTVTQDDVDSGAVSNSATATGTPPDGPPVETDDEDEVPSDPQPGLELSKSSNVTEAVLGDVITYTFVAQNTGNVTLTDVSIEDPMDGLSALDCTPVQPATLAPSETLECTATYTVTQDDVDSGAVSNSATATGTPPDGPPLETDDEDEVPSDPQPAIELVKSADADDELPDVGEVITYTFVATNTGNVTLTDVSIEDPMDGLSALDCTPVQPATLAPTETLECTATYTVTQDDVDSGAVSNSATATGTPPDGPPVETDDEDEVPSDPQPGLVFTKSSDLDTVAAGDVITYTLIAENTGNVTLTDVSIEDPMDGLSGLNCVPAQPATLAPSEMLECTATYTVTQDDVDAGGVSNAASATGTTPDDEEVDDDDEHEVPSDPQPGLVFTKSSDLDTVGVGDVITYTLIAENTGNVTLTDVSIEDPMDGLSALNCVPAQPATLAPSEMLECTATYTVTQDDVDAGGVSNAASATGTTPDDEEVDDDDEHEVPSDPQPAIDLEKTADVGGELPAVNDLVTYTFVATNTGNVTLTEVEITDPMDGLSSLSCIPNQPATLAPAQSMSCTATYAVTQDDIDSGSITNTATATGTTPDEEEVDDEDEITVPQEPDPSISLVKSSDVGSVLPAVGELVTYSFVATNTGNVTLTDVEVTDPMDGLSTLDCTPAQPATLAPDASMTCSATYQVTQADHDVGSITNLATATGTTPDEGEVEDEDEITVPSDAGPEISLAKSGDQTMVIAGLVITYTFVATNTGGVTLSEVVIDDPMPGLSPLDCQPGQPASLVPGASLTCTATYEMTTADVGNGTVQNTATVTGTPPTGPSVSDDDSYDISTPPPIPVVPIPPPPRPGLNLSKTSDAVNPSAGDTVTYTFVARNTGDVVLSGVTITDPMPGLSELECSPGQPASLAPAATLTCTATYVVTDDDVANGSIVNVATATGTPPGGPPVSSSDDEEILLPNEPGISLVKTSGGGTVNVGDTITYTFVVTNTGDTTLENVVVDDPMLGPDPVCTWPSLAPGESASCTATYVVTEADAANGSILNYAVADADTIEDPEGVTDDDTDTVIVSPPAPPPGAVPPPSGPSPHLPSTGGSMLAVLLLGALLVLAGFSLRGGSLLGRRQ